MKNSQNSKENVKLQIEEKFVKMQRSEFKSCFELTSFFKSKQIHNFDNYDLFFPPWKQKRKLEVYFQSREVFRVCFLSVAF